MNNVLKYRETPGHGYYSIEPEFNNNVPEKFRQNEYEEDIEWAIPLFFNLSLLSIYSEKKLVVSTIRNWFPNIYDSLNRKLKRTDSFLLHEALLHKENRGNYFLFGAFGDWCFDVPEGFIFVNLKQSDGSSNYQISKTFIKEVSCLVSEEEYNHLRSHNYVTEEFVKSHFYERNKEYYTWDDYTNKTGNQRYK